jgi:hypothetical protein
VLARKDAPMRMHLAAICKFAGYAVRIAASAGRAL